MILCIYFDNLVKRSVPSLVGNIPGIEMTDILINMSRVLGVTGHEVAGALDVLTDETSSNRRRSLFSLIPFFSSHSSRRITDL